MSISQDAQERINQYAKKRVVSTLINDMVSEAPAPQESIQSTGNTDDANLADNTIHTDNTGHTHTAVNTHNAGYTHNAGHTHYTGRKALFMAVSSSLVLPQGHCPGISAAAGIKNSYPAAGPIHSPEAWQG